MPLARLAATLNGMGHSERAREIVARAIALAPSHGEVRAIYAEIVGVADWYFPMVLDDRRHAAIDEALRRAVQPGSRVLDIGTGTGLLAMMAARAGAAQVITCESDPVVADVAKEVVALNGLSDRIRVIAKSSEDLELGVDIAEAADVLIWDTLGSNLIGAGAFSVLEGAVRRLLRPGGAVLPARGAVRIALPEDRRQSKRECELSGVRPFSIQPRRVVILRDERRK